MPNPYGPLIRIDNRDRIDKRHETRHSVRFITGGTGYMGSRVIRLLLKVGH
jgi:hypothetical protein